MKPQLISMPSPPYRPGTQSNKTKTFFIFKGGGIGDYICNIPCMQWIAATQPHINPGIIITAPYLVELFQMMMLPHQHWSVGTDATIDKEYKEGKTLAYTTDCKRSPNACGMHLLDLPFLTFANMEAPKNILYPRLNRLDKLRKPKALKQLLSPYTQGLGLNKCKPYVVLTAGATNKTRQLPPETFNHIVEHLIKHNLNVVVLGNAMKEAKDRTISFHDDYDLLHTINLINETTLVEAAQIMQYSKLVVGLDNGLLHLAACTDAPIVFGYNVASPEHRRPRRDWGGGIYELYPDIKTLPCTFCQSRMSFILHDFSECMYGDTACLTAMSGEKWASVIDEALSKERE